MHVPQEEEFEEDDGIYDELNLDEEEEKFGLANDEEDSDDSEDPSEGEFPQLARCALLSVDISLADLPPRTPSKKHHDDESVASSKRGDVSPIMKKAVPTIPARSESFSPPH